MLVFNLRDISTGEQKVFAIDSSFREKKIGGKEKAIYNIFRVKQRVAKVQETIFLVRVTSSTD